MSGWNPTLSIGVPEIDDQHRELFRRAHEVDMALSEGRFASETVELVRFLAEYCEKHLSTEQALMMRTRYPGTAAHLQQHTWFRQTMQAIQRDLAVGGPREEIATRLNELVLAWFVKHIGSTDRALGAFLKESLAVAAPSSPGFGAPPPIGVPSIDGQHQALFGYATRFEEAANAGAPGRQLEELFGFLADYARVHFEAEEALMREAGYPEIAQHAFEHQEFLRRLNQLVPLWEAEGDSNVLVQVLLGFIHPWLTEHVSSVDARLGAFVMDQRAGARAG
jgi:hemerythrin